MHDIQPAAAASRHKIIRREDYRPPDWLVTDVELQFDLDPAATRVRARLHILRNGEHDQALRLDGAGQTLVSLKRNDVDVEPRFEGDTLVIDIEGESATVETLVEIAPDTNTQLMGLYASGGLLCTQCEAEGFRRITFFPDRPDVLARYRVTLRADAGRFPVLLSNGDKVGEGVLEDGRHWAEWHDPFPKPSYLFALVAGDLGANRSSFTTMSGREVALTLWVRETDLAKTEHAMGALKAAMAWDEGAYGREYDLDQFNIVAVADFNFGAMENKSLNIFNSRYILADRETATDADYDAIAAVVAHEYFHNWSGNRVTCRDWFQLSLKEGFTVFRDGGFTADQGSPAVTRIEQVRSLRAAQFPEDAGPLAHPVRPENYLEISNFYTATIYQKGAEVIRMMATLLGPEAFRRGSDLYFERHDGEAATCEDFVTAMEDASRVDLGQFRLWYSQAGTPRVTAALRYDEAARRAELSLSQTLPPTPGQADKQPMLIPLRTALFGRNSGAALGEERLIQLCKAETSAVFEQVTEPPVLSINRGFSAPITVEAGRSSADLALLSAHDDDPFARYEAMQQLMLDALIAAVEGREADHAAVVSAIGETLTKVEDDPAFVAETVLLPGEAAIGDHMDLVRPDAIHAAREALRKAIAAAHAPRWREIYDSMGATAFEYSPRGKGRRRMRAIALGYLAAADAGEGARLAKAQYDGADNMTERQSAFTALVNLDVPERGQVVDAFYDRFHGDPLVLDKWFSTQAMSVREGTANEVEMLARHPDFTLANPNRLRSLVGAFGANQYAFHSESGSGYRFLADMIIASDKLNPQTAAKLVPPLGRWRRFEADRGAMMKSELERIAATASLSKDVFEQVSKSLA